MNTESIVKNRSYWSTAALVAVLGVALPSRAQETAPTAKEGAEPAIAVQESQPDAGAPAQNATPTENRSPVVGKTPPANEEKAAPQPVQVKNADLASTISQPPPAKSGERFAQEKTGFVLEPHLGVRVGFFLDTEFQLLMNSLEGGLTIGFKDDRIIWCLGFDIRRIAWKIKYSGSSSASYYYDEEEDDEHEESNAAFLFIPGIRGAVYTSDDEKVDLVLQIDFGFGGRVTKDSSDDEDASDEKYFQFTYAVGPGLRYWIHPQLAVGAVSLLSGEVIRTETEEQTEIVHLMSISAALQFTGVF